MSRPLPSLWATFLAALAPQWRLFDRVDPVPLLQVRAGPSAEAWEPWGLAAFQLAPSSWPAPWRVFANAATAERLAACSVVDRLADEAQRDDADVVVAGVTYAMVRRLAVIEVVRRGVGPAFQLRVVLSRARGGVGVGAGDDVDLLLVGPADRVGADPLDDDVAPAGLLMPAMPTTGDAGAVRA